MTAEQAISWLSLKPKELPVFVLIATDPLAPNTIEHWILEAKAAGVRPEKILAASGVCFEFEHWTFTRSKLPD